MTSKNTLVIANVKDSDNAMFTCEGRNQLGVITEDVNVIVKQGLLVENLLLRMGYSSVNFICNF